MRRAQLLERCGCFLGPLLSAALSVVDVQQEDGVARAHHVGTEPQECDHALGRSVDAEGDSPPKGILRAT